MEQFGGKFTVHFQKWNLYWHRGRCTLPVTYCFLSAWTLVVIFHFCQLWAALDAVQGRALSISHRWRALRSDRYECMKQRCVVGVFHCIYYFWSLWHAQLSTVLDKGKYICLFYCTPRLWTVIIVRGNWTFLVQCLQIILLLHQRASVEAWHLLFSCKMASVYGLTVMLAVLIVWWCCGDFV